MRISACQGQHWTSEYALGNGCASLRGCHAPRRSLGHRLWRSLSSRRDTSHGNPGRRFVTEEEGGGRERESDSDEARREGRAKRVQKMRIEWEGSPSHLRHLDGDSVQCIAQKFYKKPYGSHAAPGCSALMASPLSRINLNMNS